MEKVVLFGTGQIASVFYSYLTYDSPSEVVAFAVDRKEIKEDTLFGLPVVPFENVASIYPSDEYRMFVAVSYKKLNRLRAEKYRQAKALGYQLISYVHSKATLSPDAVIGDNCIISPNSVILPHARIGNNVHIGSGTIVGHHTVIGDHCWVTAGALIMGTVIVEPYCFLGANATVRDRLTIARECIIGAGALILGDTQEREVYMGTSAERLPISSNELPFG